MTVLTEKELLEDLKAAEERGDIKSVKTIQYILYGY